MFLTERKQTYNVELTILIMHVIRLLLPILTFWYTQIQVSLEGTLQTLYNHGEVCGINEKIDHINVVGSNVIDIGI